MIYITGDTHGDFSRYDDFAREHSPGEDDVMIVLGDAGLNILCGDADKKRKRYVASFPFATFCIHGNHEKRPADIPGYLTKLWRGGEVWYEEQYPNILFARDGEVYDFGGLSCLVIGGAYSVDKSYRLAFGLPWFENEQPDDEIKARVERKIRELDCRVDVVLTHTCPIMYEPTEVFMAGIDQSRVDKSTERWLGYIEYLLDYKKWYCGHYHTKKTFGKFRFMFEDIEPLSL